MSADPLSAAVLASGSGTNFQALLDHEGTGTAEWHVALLLSDREEAGALARARKAGVATRVVPFRGRPPAEIARDLLAALAEAHAEVVFLAGFLRLIPAEVVTRYRGRILNIHPALLPAFGGPGMWGHHVHEAVIASGARISGPTVHLVNECYDEGTILAQWPVPVLDHDTPDVLAARVLEVEHRLYPRVADHVCHALREGREPAPLDPPGTAFDLVAGIPESHL